MRSLSLFPIPRRRLALIFLGLLLNAIIFSASFTFFTSFNEFKTSYLGSDEDTVVIYNPSATTIFTGSVPSFLTSYIQEFPGIISASPEVIASTVTLDGTIVTVRGVDQEFFRFQPLNLEWGSLEDFSEGTCLVGANAYERLGISSESILTLRSTLKKTIYEHTPVAVYSTGTPLDDEIIVPIETARGLSGYSIDLVSLIRVKLDKEKTDESSIRQILSQPYNLVLNVSSQEERSWITTLEITQNGNKIEERSLKVPSETTFNLLFGEYQVSISNQSRTVTLDSNQTLNFDLREELYKLEICIVDATSNDPIPDTDLTIIVLNRSISATTNSNGIAIVYLPEGEYTITSTLGGVTKSKTILVNQDIQTTLVQGPFPLTIKVSDALNEQIQGATIQISNEQETITATTDSEGVSVNYLKEDTYIITVSSETLTESKTITLTNTQTLNFNLGTPLPKYDLIIHVQWFNETKVKGAEITVTGAQSWQGYSDHEGNFAIHDIPAQPLQITAAKNGLTLLEVLVLNQDTVVNLDFNTVNFETLELTSQMIRYLPQSVAVNNAGQVFRNSMKTIVNLITATLVVLASLLTISTIASSVDIIQNAINESKRSIGVIRSLGATQHQTNRIINTGLLLMSTIVGILGYVIGYLIISTASSSHLLLLSGYSLQPRFNFTLLFVSTSLTLFVTWVALTWSLREVHSQSIMDLLKGLRRKDILYLRARILAPVTAFSIPFIVRALPEIIVWPYPTGYDTISSYLPDLILLRTGFESQVYEFVNQRPFFWVIASLPYPFDQVIPFKFLPVLMHGLLGVSVYYYARELFMDESKAVTTALVSTFYFIGMRISWDLYGHELGLILVFISLTFLTRGLKNWQNIFFAFTSILATMLTHEAAGILLFVSVTPLALSEYRKRGGKGLVTWVTVVGIPLLFFIYRLRVLDFPLLSNPMNNYRYPSETIQQLADSVTTLYIYTVLPLIPFSLLGVRQWRKHQSMTLLLLAATLAALSPLFSPTLALTFWSRWTYMTVYPLAFLAVEGIFWLRNLNLEFYERKINLGKAAGTAFIVSLLFISTGFILSSSEASQPYHRLFGSESSWINHHVPTSMQLSTISPREAEDAVSSIIWLNENAAESVVVLVDEELRGYAAYYCDKEKILIKDIGTPWYSTPRYIERMLEQAYILSAQGFDVYFIGRDFRIEELKVVKRGDMINVYHLEK